MPGVPVLNDDDPFWGSPSDPTATAKKMPVNPTDYPGYGIRNNLTFRHPPVDVGGRRTSNMW